MKKNKQLAVISIFLLCTSLIITYLASLSPYFIENYYSRFIYKFIGPNLSSFTGLTTISLAETIIISSLLLIITVFFSAVYKSRKNKQYLLKATANLFFLLSLAYFLFIFLWGLNYYRLPFAEISGLQTKPASVAELEELCKDLIAEANSWRTKVQENNQGIMTIPLGSDDVFKRASKGYEKAQLTYPVLYGNFGNPKSIFFSETMSYTGIAGIYFPFTAEANVNVNITDSMLPCTTAHEMAHQRGFAREDEANFIAYLTCTMHPDADFQYSGYLLALVHSMNALGSYDYDKFTELKNSYSPSLKNDLQAIREHWQRYEGPVERISSEINNAYLKANRQKEGIYSYGRMVDLLIAEYRLSQ